MRKSKIERSNKRERERERERGGERERGREREREKEREIERGGGEHLKSIPHQGRATCKARSHRLNDKRKLFFANTSLFHDLLIKHQFCK